MNVTDLRVLFDHLYWMRDRVLAATAAPGFAFADPATPTLRDLRTALVHELDVEWSWRRRLAQADRRAFPADDVELVATDFATLDDLRARWEGDEDELRAWLDGLSDADLAAPCGVEEGAGHPFWLHLQHIYAHGVLQLGEAAVILTAAGCSPGDLDFLEFVRADQR